MSTLLEDAVRQAHNDTVRALTRALDLHDPGEGGHAARVAVYSVAIGEKMGMSDEDLISLRWAAELHDVGKIAVDQSLLRKLGDLSNEDISALKLHAMLAMGVLESFDWLASALPMIRHHHERWDGTGYPEGLRAEQIPLGARIIAAAEVFDTMIAGRPWKRSLREEDALAELSKGAGTQFDPAVIDALQATWQVIQPLPESLGV